MWKKVLFSLLGLVVIGAGFFSYFFFIKDYDIEDEQVDKILENEYDLTIPQESTIEPTDKEESNSIPENRPDESSISNNNESEELTTGDSHEESNERNSNSTSSTKAMADEQTGVEYDGSQGEKATAQEIIAKYKPTFSSLHSQAEARLNELAEYAYSEYKEEREAGENISYTYLFQKYKSAAARLEDKTDSVFNQVYGQLVNELENNGYSSEKAQAIYDEYQTVKDSTEKKLMKKMLESIN
ncbi:hypothetical protein [Gracilibacillus xinjiangensis]|uniref:Uncharacterized protein n=1 Tax=Gracilibacillus xinjiangensis TaxID=1193282 RepID=A0ABV8WTT7_9BACI